MGTSFVKSDHEETDSVWPTSVFLGVNLCLLMNPLKDLASNRWAWCLLSAMEETSRLAGMGRL